MRPVYLPFIFFSITLFAIVSCHKEASLHTSFPMLQNEFRDSLGEEGFYALDWHSTTFSNEGEHRFIRIGVSGHPFDKDFILASLDNTGSIQEGRRIHLSVDSNLNGIISISYLNAIPVLVNAEINKGYIVWRTGTISLREMAGVPHPESIVPGADGKVLPEVIVVATVKKPNVSLINYYSLYGLLGGGISGNSSYYSSSASSTGGSSSSGSTTDNAGASKNIPTGKSETKATTGAGGTAQKDDVILVDFETSIANPAISLDQYVKCFSYVPDNGATCSIEILTDIPVDGHPEEFFDWRTGSPGHSFLRIQKTNGANSVLQVIGFYPSTGWKTIGATPIESKFADNGGHEFNASIKMTLTSLQFQNVLIEISKHKADKYDLDEYNCTDFALQVFNSQRSVKLVIPKYNIPGGSLPANTPEGLYEQLQNMKTAGTAEAANITMPGVKGFVATSKGPCN